MKKYAIAICFVLWATTDAEGEGETGLGETDGGGFWTGVLVVLKATVGVPDSKIFLLLSASTLVSVLLPMCLN